MGSVRLKGVKFRDLKRNSKRIKRAAITRALRWLHTTAQPQKFKNRALSLYPGVFHPRQGERGRQHRYGFRSSYTGKKLARFGHTRPLTFTGAAQRRARVLIIRNTRLGQKKVIQAPTFNRKTKNSPINMRAEITALNRRDVRFMQKVYADERQRRIKQLERRPEQRISTG